MKGGNPKLRICDDVVTYCDLESLLKYTYKYSIAKYIQTVLVSVNRGRPRLKRIRSRGAASSDDRERLRKRSMGLRQGRGSAQAGREALEACSLST